MVCRYCGQPRHREARCEAKLELDKYGDYKHEIIEGRNAALQEREMSQKNGNNDSRTQNDTMKSATSVTSASRTKPLTTEETLASSSTQDEPIVTVIISDSNLENIDTSLPGANIQAESRAAFLPTRNFMGLAAKQFAGKPKDAGS